MTDETGAGLTTTAPTPPVPQGRAQDFITNARAQGYSWDDINGFMSDKRKQAQEAGYSDEQINEFLGIKPGNTVDAQLRDETDRDIKAEPPKGFFGPPDPRTGRPAYYTDNPLLLAREGMARSSLGRVMESFVDMPMFENGTAGVEPRGTLERILTGTTEAIGDIPAAEVGIAGGFVAGGPGSAGAGAFAVPT